MIEVRASLIIMAETDEDADAVYRAIHDTEKVRSLTASIREISREVAR